jgi:hypothetical protein
MLIFSKSYVPVRVRKIHLALELKWLGKLTVVVLGLGMQGETVTGSAGWVSIETSAQALAVSQGWEAEYW